MVQAIVEVRDYTIDPEWLEPYRKWATELAVPWLRANLDLVEFWMDCGFDAEVSGTNPAPSVNGQPNVCWIIRFRRHRQLFPALTLLIGLLLSN